MDQFYGIYPSLELRAVIGGYVYRQYRKGGFPGKVRVLFLEDTQNIGLIKVEMSTP